MNADMVGVQSGVTTLVDQGGPSCMTLPASGIFVAEPAKSGFMLSCRLTWSAGWRATIIPAYSPEWRRYRRHGEGGECQLRSRARIKAHAEIGGFARWGIRVIEMAAEIGRRTDLPVYVHFGQLWGLPKAAPTAKTSEYHSAACHPAAARGDVLRIRSRASPAASSTAR